MSDKLRECPSCGSTAHIEDKTKNRTGHKGIEFGRIVCDNNRPFEKPENRCYMKTVCGPLKEVLRTWNTRHEPKHETVEQWEDRTGDTYPDEGPVWMKIDDKDWVLNHRDVLLAEVYPTRTILIVANQHGKPEDIK